MVKMNKKSEMVAIRMAPETKEHLYKVAKEYTHRNSLSDAIITGLQLFELTGNLSKKYAKSSLDIAKNHIETAMPALYELAEKYAEGSIEVLLYKIKSMLEKG